MITRVTNGLYKALAAFLTANYSSGNDALSSSPVYINPTPEFDPTDAESYAHVLKSGNVSFVIWNTETTPREDYPTGYYSFEYSANLTVVRKSANAWDAANRLNRVVRGSSAAPYMNSIQNVMMNFAAYLQENKLNDGSGLVTFWQKMGEIQSPIVAGDFISITGNVTALAMYSTTLSVTPV